MKRAALIGMLVAGMASADTVVMKSGARLTGAATVEGDTVFVRVGCGLVKVKRGDVAQIIESRSALEEYEVKAAEAKDAKAHLALADWCASQKLTRGERLELEAVLAAEPDHASARARLGYERVGAQWLRGEALLRSKGLVNHEGEWMTPAAAEGARQSAAVARLDRVKSALRDLDRRLEREMWNVRWRAYARTVARMSYRPMSRYRDEKRGVGYRSWKSWGYAIGPRNAPGHIVGIGGWIRSFDLPGRYFFPWW